MSLVQETDYGTPRSRATEEVRLTIDGHAVTVPAGTSIMRAAIDAGIKVPKLCATDSVEAFGSCRLCLVEIDGRRGTPASCTTPVAPGMVVSTQTERLAAAPQGRDGALHLRPSARLPDLRRQRRLRAAGHGGRGRPARGALRLRGREPPRRSRRTSPTRTSPSTPSQVHRLLALRARLRRDAGHVRADHRRAAASTPRSSAGARTSLPRLRVRVLRRLRAGLPDGHAAGEDRSSSSAADALGDHHLRLLRRRLLVQGRDARRARWCAWCPTRTARPTTATPASRAASPGATPPTATASSSR